MIHTKQHDPIKHGLHDKHDAHKNVTNPVQPEILRDKNNQDNIDRDNRDNRNNLDNRDNLNRDNRDNRNFDNQPIQSLVENGSISQLANSIDSLYNTVKSEAKYAPLVNTVQDLKNVLERFHR